MRIMGMEEGGLGAEGGCTEMDEDLMGDDA